MIGIIFELVLSYVQFSSTILVPSATAGDSAEIFPKEWKDPMYYMSILNLGFDIISGIIVSLDDLRVFFMTVCVILPLAMNFFGLFFLNKQRVVIWYFLTLSFFLTLCVGAFARAISSTISINISDQVAELLLYIGLGGSAACWLVCFCAYKGVFGKVTDESDEKKNRRREMENETRDSNTRRTVGLFFLCLFWAALGCAFHGFIPYVEDEVDANLTYHFSFGLAVLCYALSFGHLVFFIFSLFYTGRQWTWRFNEFMRLTFLKVLLLALSSLYIPIGAATFTIFNCNTIECPAGTRIPSKGMSLVLNSTMGKCVPCEFAYNQTCPSSLQSMCLGMTDDRLETDMYIGCEGMKNFFWPAGVLIILFYLLGVPLLFFWEIRASTRLLMDDFPIKEPVAEEGESRDEFDQRRWETKVLMCDNSARFLFDAFEFKFRYMRLMLLIQKLIVVFTSVFVIRYGDLSPRFIVLGISLLVHGLVTIILISFRPFNINIHDFVGVATHASLCLIIMFAIAIAAEVEFPSELLTATMAANFAVPALCVVIGLVYYGFNRQREAKEAEDEMLRRAEIEAGLEDLQVEKGEVVCVPGEVQNPLTVSSPTITGKKRERERVRRIRIREKIRRDLQREMDDLREAQMDSDVHIDQRIQRLLRVFLMLGGAFATLALGLCILGLWSVQKTDLRSSVNNATMVTSKQIASYPDWPEFTSSCCCAASKSAVDLELGSTGPRDVEIWMCGNGVVQERIRSIAMYNSTSGKSYLVDGFSMRPMCSASFSSGCAVSPVTGTDMLTYGCTGQNIPQAPTHLW
eukprot:GILI01006309.1.p1 GENE.GILI01006309.1~~GILI01006309.1.p1  ORF type:complete len:802 (+),score=77.58 GILI01006309.1:30-2435(+)